MNGLKIRHDHRETIAQVCGAQVCHSSIFIVKAYACVDVPVAEMEMALMIGRGACVQKVKRARDEQRLVADADRVVGENRLQAGV